MARNMAKSFYKKPIVVAPQLSQEQSILSGMFGGGEQTWGTGQNLPRMDGILMNGGGIIKSGDGGETASMFGMK